MRNNKEIIDLALDRYRLSQAAASKGIKVDDVQVAAYIRQSQSFQVKGQFNLNMYKMFVTYYLGRFGIQEKQLERTIRENLIADILRNQIMNSVVVTDDGAKQYYTE